MVHELKTLPAFFDAVTRGDKTFEVRKDDRGFAAGDVLWLREWNPDSQRHGAGYVRRVTYVLKGGQFGIDKDWCVLGLGAPTIEDHAAVARYRQGGKTV